jgi:hypothetical protein
LRVSSKNRRLNDNNSRANINISSEEISPYSHHHHRHDLIQLKKPVDNDRLISNTRNTSGANERNEITVNQSYHSINNSNKVVNTKQKKRSSTQSSEIEDSDIVRSTSQDEDDVTFKRLAKSSKVKMKPTDAQLIELRRTRMTKSNKDDDDDLYQDEYDTK